MRANKPLLGFGPAGWALLAVAIGLAYLWYSGYDLRFQLLRLIRDLFGVDTMMWFVSAPLAWHWLNVCMGPPDMSFGLIGMCAAFIAMQVYPSRVHWYKWLLVGCAGLLTPPFIIQLTMALPSTSGTSIRLVISGAVCQIPAIVVLSWIFRGWIVPAGLTALVIVGSATTCILMLRLQAGTVDAGFLEYFVYWFSWAWNPLLFALLLFVAVRARLRGSPPGICTACGYDLRGIKSGVCPECGAEARAHKEPIAEALVGAGPLPSRHE